MKNTLISKGAPFIAGAALLFAGSAFAKEMPPVDGKPLSRVIQGIEEQGYTPVDAAYDDGRWEVKAYRDDTLQKLKVDPMTGEITQHKKDRL
ncbi:MAG: PepSY domain-containing protein [Chromatiales bacterium]|jgi:hypothetical protein|nr:PepSY domain-containing protein [Chromatiales bacterium]